MITRVMRKTNFIDRTINRMADGRTLAALFLYSAMVAACMVCFAMLQSVHGTYLWWTTTIEGQLTAEANPEELYRNLWWGILTIVNNVVCMILFLRVVFRRLQQLEARKYSIYPIIPYTGVFTGAISSLYFIVSVWSLVSNNLQLLLKRQLITISGIWQELFPYHKIKVFAGADGNFLFSWNTFWSFNLEMILYFLVFTIVLQFISQFILSYYSYVIESRITLQEESNKSNYVRRDAIRPYTLDDLNRHSKSVDHV